MTIAGSDPRPFKRSSAPSRAAAALTLAVALAAGGYLAGRHASPASVAVHHGTAVITPTQIGATSAGISYAIPLDVPWRDRTGGWHQGDRPSCLPTTATSAPVTFGAVKYQLDGVGGYAVVWVDCSR